MKPSRLRDELIEEIYLIPDTELAQIYQMIHDFRLSSEKRQDNLKNTLKFAGNWDDLTEEQFTELSAQITLRRQQASRERRNDESIADLH